jgi:PmbA protein
MVPTAAVASFSTVTRMANSAGLDLSFRSGGGYAYAVALATKDGDRKTGMDFATAVRPDALALDRIPPTAADKALTMLGASPVKSGKYRVIVKPEQVASFLQFLLEMVSADVVQKGMSALAGRVGSRIAGEAVTLIDEPVVNESLFNLPFDSQGVATRRKEIVADGVLTTFLHSLKTAAKDDVAPTGNGFRAGYRGAETIHPVNLVLAAGEYSYEQLLGRLGDGLVINWLSGLHAGTEAASGEFSLSATGLLVEGGTVVRPVDQITISGNLLDLLGGVEAVGSDLTQAPVFSFGLYTPSILVGEVDIAGE